MMTEVSSPTTLSLALLIILATTTASGMYHHFISLPQYEWPQPFRDTLLAAFAGATGYRPEANGQNHHNGVGNCLCAHRSLRYALGCTYQRGASTNLMIQKQTAKLNIAAAIVKPIWLRMKAP